MTCEEIDELAGAIALDAVPDAEWPAIRAHLASCTRGHHELRELREAALLLLEAAPPIDPPAGLRERILAAARAESGSPPAAAAPMQDASPDREVLPPAVVMRTERAWWQRAAWPAAAAAVLVAGALAVWNVALRGDLRDTEDRLAGTVTRVEATERALAVLVGGGQQFAFAASLPGAGGSVLRPETGTATLVLEGLLPTPDMTYQVWAIQSGQMVSLGIFEPDASGRKVVTLGHDLHNVDAVAITREPAPSGSRLPTSLPLLLAPIRG